MLPKFATPLAIVLTIYCSVAATAADILVLGDSWGVGINNSITTVAGAGGFTVDNRANGGDTAANMASGSGLLQLTSDLNANPDAKVVHMMIGGNDFLNGWSPFLTPSAQQLVFDSIIADVETIANHIATVRPDIQTYHMGYEFPRLNLPVSAAVVNNAILSVSAMEESINAPNYNYIEFYGLTQEVFGYNGNPPDGTSNPNFQGAAAAFSDEIHLNQAGYLLYAQASYNTFRVALVPEPSSAFALLLSSVGTIGYRRRR